MHDLGRYSLVVLLLACSEPQTGFDLGESPEDLDDFDRKTDGDPCADWAGGPLSGDDPLVVVNKNDGQQLERSWTPPDSVPVPPSLMMPGRRGELRYSAMIAAEEMFAAAANEAGLEFGIRSAYRSFRTQCITFNFKVNQHGVEHARRFSAEPGRSQHQLATTIDISSARLGWALEQSMGIEPEGEWLAANAHRFGFALSYPPDSESITGYAFEPWHYRYIGRDAAVELDSSDLILEQYLVACSDGDVDGLECPREAMRVSEPNHGWIGGACATDDDCYAVTGAVCLTDGYTGGTCSRSCSAGCPDLAGRNSLTFCVADDNDAGLCHSQCDAELYPETGCRPGYQCVSGSRPGGTRSADVCLPEAPDM